jgi:predicted aspartyl protease
MQNIPIQKPGRYKILCLFVLCLISVKTGIYADIPDDIHIPHVRTNFSVSFPPDMSDEPLGDFQMLTIPLKRAGRLFLIEARIDGQLGNLIFDTGATGLVLNKTYFRKYASDEKPAGGGITGASGKIFRIMVKRIEISDLFYQDVAADLMDLGHIENRRGVKILGLFGLNMIAKFEVIFNAKTSELQLFRVDKQGARLNALPSELKYDFTQKMDTKYNIMVVRGKIGEKTLNFCLDTGAESNVISSDVSKKVMSTIQINRRSGMGGAGAASDEVLYGTMSEFEFGDHQFGNMQTVVTSLDAMCESYGCSIDGMLGYDFWQKGIFCFNFKKSEISFSLAKGDKK